MNAERLHDLADCTEFRQTLLARPPRLVGATFVLLVALVAAAAAWAAATEADLVVRAAGRVRPMVQSAQQPDAAAEESQISPLRGGRVIEVHVQEGDEIKSGELLVRLETEQLDSDLAKQRQLLRAAEEELARLDQTESMLDERYIAAAAKAKAELTEARESLATAKKRQTAAIALAESQLKLADEELTRARKLVARRVVAQAELSRIQTEWRAATLKLHEGRLPLDEGRLPVLEQATRLVAKEHAVEREKVDAARERKRNEIAATRIEIERVEWERRQSELRAPVNGSVTSLDVHVGDVVEAGEPLLAVAEQRGFRIDVAVLSADVGHLSVGMPVRVKLDAYDYQKYGTVAGRVAFVSPDSLIEHDQSNGSMPTYLVKIALDVDHVGGGDRLGRIKLGMTGVAEIITDRESILSLLVRSIRQSISLAG
jgi:multidrug resistance efflux pump